MIHYDDLTEAELEVRALLKRKRSDFERGKPETDPFRAWAAETRAAWAATPAGKRAIAACEAERAKARRGRR